MARPKIPEGMQGKHGTFRAGQHVIVTDGMDSGGFGHQFQKDQELVLKHFDNRDNSWWCTTPGFEPDEDYPDNEEENWISEDDLEHLLPPPSKEEVQAAINSILGVS